MGIPVTQGVALGWHITPFQGLNRRTTRIFKTSCEASGFTQNEELLEAYEAHIKWKRDCNTGIVVAKSLRKGWVFL